MNTGSKYGLWRDKITEVYHLIMAYSQIFIEKLDILRRSKFGLQIVFHTQ